MCDGCDEKGGPQVSRRRLLAGLPPLVGMAAASILIRDRSAVPSLPLEASPASQRVRRILCKDAWGGEPPSRGLQRHSIRRITVHHSGLKLTDNRDSPGRFRSYQRDHKSLGWPDIAYHVLIDRHGNVYKGRPAWARGDTRTSYNTEGHFLVMCEGNMSEQGVSKRQMSALVDVLAWATERFSVPVRRIHGHRDFAETSCPGADLYREIRSGRLDERVRRRLAGGGADLRRLCGDAGRERVRSIERGTD